MRKTLLLSTLIVAATASFTSCNKQGDWNCYCETGGGDGFNRPMLDMKKSDAKDACDALETSTTTCDLNKK